ncbi:hypothetical protein I2494_12540 [Budviciaceae bacterium BWR-B9]|uniref:Uncharacterized protein n=1 Tax=Limnobaculum allomyrinae TaxID=2791986 RepID=A0ABS1IS09_9GAMM|nr:hypothetical protein [Limnobaculum sp. M2-1]MBK5144534.1 hypothetical protein [Limnobaculum allomyrinae]MBV7692237.1 hypothetical protein [Limnobaculum sp. M2-1]
MRKCFSHNKLCAGSHYAKVVIATLNSDIDGFGQSEVFFGNIIHIGKSVVMLRGKTNEQ